MSLVVTVYSKVFDNGGCAMRERCNSILVVGHVVLRLLVQAAAADAFATTQPLQQAANECRHGLPA